jgi:hypothetical protein
MPREERGGMATRLNYFYYKGKKIEIGAAIKVLPSKKGKHDGFFGTVLGIYGENGKVVGIETMDPKNRNLRTLYPERVVPYVNSTKKARGLQAKKKVK